MWKLSSLFLSFARGWLPVLYWCLVPGSWHWSSCLWKEALRWACWIRRKESLLGLVTPQKPMVMSLCSVCVTVCADTYWSGQQGVPLGSLWCGSCVFVCVCARVHMCICVYWCVLWGHGNLSFAKPLLHHLLLCLKSEYMTVSSSYCPMEPFLWVVLANIKVIVKANLLLIRAVPWFRRWYGYS